MIAELATRILRRVKQLRLQWGRDHVIAELGGHTRCLSSSLRLQWGRDHVIAELRPPAAPPRPAGCFNGAAIT